LKVPILLPLRIYPVCKLRVLLPLSWYVTIAVFFPIHTELLVPFIPANNRPCPTTKDCPLKPNRFQLLNLFWQQWQQNGALLLLKVPILVHVQVSLRVQLPLFFYVTIAVFFRYMRSCLYRSFQGTLCPCPLKTNRVNANLVLVLMEEHQEEKQMRSGIGGGRLVDGGLSVLKVDLDDSFGEGADNRIGCSS